MLEQIVYVLNLILQEYLSINGGAAAKESSGVLLDHGYVSSFLASIQDRVEFVYSQFHALEQIEFKDPKQASKHNILI